MPLSRRRAARRRASALWNDVTQFTCPPNLPPHSDVARGGGKGKGGGGRRRGTLRATLSSSSRCSFHHSRWYRPHDPAPPPRSHPLHSRQPRAAQGREARGGGG